MSTTIKNDKNGTEVTINVGGAGITIDMRMDKGEARGNLTLQESPYGWLLYVEEGEPVALLDLFYNSDANEESKEKNLAAQIVVHSPAQTDDAIAMVKFYRDQPGADIRTEILSENGVECETTGRAGWKQHRMYY